MIPILHPSGLNWFYEAQAALFARDLAAEGTPACSVDVADFRQLANYADDVVLVVNYAEIASVAERNATTSALKRHIERFRRRILVNHDCILTPWFKAQIKDGPRFFSEIFDICMVPQTDRGRVFGIPYQWIPEAFGAEQLNRLRPWSPARPLPWTIIGHATPDRAALSSAAIQVLSPQGFVFCPPLRPFHKGSGLDGTMIATVLAETDVYLWGSHHQFPYHETLRALDAVAAGAVPAKIDPLYGAEVAVPWVYPSIKALARKIADVGQAELHRQARTFIEGHGRVAQILGTRLVWGRKRPRRGRWLRESRLSR